MLRPQGDYQPWIDFRFSSHGVQTLASNREWHIMIWTSAQETVDVIYRSLGSAPVLTRRDNGRIITTTLEWDAECQVDGELAALYTQNPTAYLVTLMDNSANEYWCGWIVPELYSAPYRNAPYDVHLVATDNLMELQRAKHTDTTRRQLCDHVKNILDRAGYQTSLSQMFWRTSLRETARGVRLWNCYAQLVDGDAESAPTYWEVLDRILAISGATLMQYEGRWLIMDDEKQSADEHIYNSLDFLPLSMQSAPYYYTLQPIQRQAQRTWLPEGFLTDAVEPARNTVTVTAPFVAPRNVVAVDQSASASFSADYNAWWMRSFGALGLVVAKSPSNRETGETPYCLRLVVTPYAYNDGDDVSEAEVQFHITLKTENTSTTRHYNFNKLRWQASQPLVKTLKLECDTWDPESGEALPEAQTVELQLPFVPSGTATLAVVLDSYNDSTEFGLFVHEVSLAPVMAFDGWRNSYALNNGAREEAAAVQMAAVDYPSTVTSARAACVPNGLSTVQTPVLSNHVTGSWRNDTLAVTGSLVNMCGLMRSAAVGLPRTRRTGTLMSTSTIRVSMPLAVSDGVGGTAYLVRSGSWNILEQTVDIDALTFPTASISGVTPSEKKIKNRLK